MIELGIISEIGELPWYVWLGLFLILNFVFSDHSRWKKEVKFPFKPDIGSGEVEIEHSKQHGTMLEVEMRLKEPLQNKPIEVFFNDSLVCTMPAEHNDGTGRDFKEPTTLPKPTAGDTVDVRIEGQTVFQGVFT